MSVHRLAAAAALSLLAALPARSRTGLLALERDGSLLVFELRPGPTEGPDLVVPGRPGAAHRPELLRRWTRSATGEWSEAGRLPEGLRGLPFMHGLEPWLAELTQRSRLGPAVELFPLRRFQANDRVSLVRDPRAVALSVESPDGWNFRVTELLADGLLAVREHTSHGPQRQVEESAAWATRPGWPLDASLAGAAGPAGTALVFARAPGETGDELLAGRFDESGWSPLPSLRLPAGSPALGLHLGGAPAALVAGPEALTLWRLAGIAWEPHGRLQLPGAERGAWTAVAGAGGDAGRLFAIGLQGGVLSAWRWSEGRWTEEDVPEGELASTLAPPPLEPAPEPQRSGARRWLLVLPLAGVAGLLLLLAAAHLGRRAVS